MAVLYNIAYDENSIRLVIMVKEVKKSNYIFRNK